MGVTVVGVSAVCFGCPSILIDVLNVLAEISDSNKLRFESQVILLENSNSERTLQSFCCNTVISGALVVITSSHIPITRVINSINILKEEKETRERGKLFLRPSTSNIFLIQAVR